ncbi:MAG: hypothetical protein R2699_14850 [Acidimicrobiales bacterium]
MRIGTSLAELPQIADAPAAGAVSEGIVEAMVRAATPANEGALLEAASVASGMQLRKVIRSYQRGRTNGPSPIAPA